MPAGVEQDLATPACPVCGQSSRRTADAPGWGSWQRCPACTLQFVDPLRLPTRPTTLYEQAYQGQVELSGMTQYRDRIAHRKVVLEQLDEPALGFWTPAFAEALAWFRDRLPAGAPLLELGCALGYFLTVAKEAGFDVTGLDVAETVTRLAQERGFRVWHGELDSLPEAFVRPLGVASFFVIHHLDDPLPWLAEVRRRFPTALLAVAAHGHGRDEQRVDERTSTPPRTLTRWNETSLAAVCRAAGYDVEIRTYASTGAGNRRLEPAQRLMQRLLAHPAVWRTAKRLETTVAPWVYRSLRDDSAVLLALASPHAG